MIVAMRRSVRVGPNAGSPLEEFGVAPDVLHLMTRRDLVDDNVDLLARAARLIRQQPSYRLSVAAPPGTSGVTVSAASKVPASKAHRAIVRVDVYVNGRPVTSIDAADGAVPPTRVALGRHGRKRTLVEAQAWDRAGLLVAVRRLAVRTP
jgi:hypothetical protein